ncbi:MAG: endonuclease I [Pseudohongiellaceae bacterium]|jgi:endonuclease I
MHLNPSVRGGVSRRLLSCRVSLALVAAALCLVASSPDVRAQGIPPGYYNTVDDSSPASLRFTIHGVIDDHTAFPYTSSGTDTWDILEEAMEDPADSGRVLDVYHNESVPKQGGGNPFYDREHAWPKSYGFPDLNSMNTPYTDCHMLWLCDGSYNSSRGNKPFRFCSSSCDEKVTDLNDGQGGTSGSYPSESNWTSGSSTAGTWEVWSGRRGDIARAMLYADVRYEGGIHGVTSDPEADLILTDVQALIAASNTGNNESVAYMGMLAVLLQWHVADPVDAWEMNRNDVVYSYQGNRNPFVDHPEWVDCLFTGNCGGVDITPPGAVTGLVAVAGNGDVSLDWADNFEPDLAGYTVYSSTVSGGPYAALSGSLLPTSNAFDGAVVNGTTYFYVATATDTSSNESAISAEVMATPSTGGSPGGVPWINEFHYDNASTDVGEMIEIAGPVGTDLSGWTVVGYNGNGGASYATFNLAGTITDQQAGFGTLQFLTGQLQNGSPDGLALVDSLNNVIEFISYEGVILATGGPANGMSSVDVGVSESFTTPAGFSLQLAGTGNVRADFSWTSEGAETGGVPNTAQTFVIGGVTNDCNENGIEDATDIAMATSLDLDMDGIPDECQTPWTDLGFALAGITGEPTLDGLGLFASDTTYTVSLANGNPSSLAVLFLGTIAAPVPFKGGQLVPIPFIQAISLGTDSSGELELVGVLPPGLPAGLDLVLQYWIADGAAVAGASASNGLKGTTTS